jgi:L,D-peptidoglycan transpeptidase YkuD (ErfK/YbiS/YcfS/YnhG family)
MMSRRAEAMKRAPAKPLLRNLVVHAQPGRRARGWLAAGPFRMPCALGPAGIVRRKREGDGATPAGTFALLWAYYRPDRKRPPRGGVPMRAMRKDQGWCEDPESACYNRPVRAPRHRGVDHMWRADDLYDLTIVLDYNLTRRKKGAGSAIFFHHARPGLTPTAGCVAIRASDMRKLLPRLSAQAVMTIG